MDVHIFTQAGQEISSFGNWEIDILPKVGQTIGIGVGNLDSNPPISWIVKDLEWLFTEDSHSGEKVCMIDMRVSPAPATDEEDGVESGLHTFGAFLDKADPQS